MANEKYPVRGQVYTGKEVETELTLRDSAFLRFIYKGKLCVIQGSTVTTEQQMAVPGFAESRWRYQYETREWIPLFICADEVTYNAEHPDGTHLSVLEFVDIEPDIDFNGRQTEHYYVTYKGHYETQYYADPANRIA